MSTAQIIVFSGLGVLFLYFLFSQGTSPAKLLTQAINTKDISPVLQHAHELPERQRSIFYQQTIQKLWDGYHRELAASVIRDFVTKNPEEKICQFWIRQLLELEGELAREHLEEDFLSRYYKPEVAACCGITGS